MGNSNSPRKPFNRLMSLSESEKVALEKLHKDIDSYDDYDPSIKLGGVHNALSKIDKELLSYDDEFAQGDNVAVDDDESYYDNLEPSVAPVTIDSVIGSNRKYNRYFDTSAPVAVDEEEESFDYSQDDINVLDSSAVYTGIDAEMEWISSYVSSRLSNFVNKVVKKRYEDNQGAMTTTTDEFIFATDLESALNSFRIDVKLAVDRTIINLANAESRCYDALNDNYETTQSVGNPGSVFMKQGTGKAVSNVNVDPSLRYTDEDMHDEKMIFGDSVETKPKDKFDRFLKEAGISPIALTKEDLISKFLNCGNKTDPKNRLAKKSS